MKIRRFPLAGLVAFVLASGVGSFGAEAPQPSPGEQDRPTGRRLPVRIVPQMYWRPRGLVDPTGRFAATTGRFGRGLRIIDLKRKRLAWAPELPPGAMAFSGKGDRLAVSLSRGGFILHLDRDAVTDTPWLVGTALAFSPDDRHLYQAAASKQRSGTSWIPYVDQVEVRDLDGRLIKSHPLKMNLVGRLRFSADGKALTVDGGVGRGLELRTRGSFHRASQTIDLATGRSAFAKVDGAGAAGLGYGRLFESLSFRDILAADEGRTLAQGYRGLFWDPPSQSMVTWASGTLKAWDLAAARFTGTLGRSNNVDVGAMLRAGVFVGSAWHDTRKLPEAIARMKLPAPPGYAGTHSIKLLTLFDLKTGAARPLGIPTHGWTALTASPDGRHVAGLTDQPVQDFTSRVEVWNLSGRARTAAIAYPKQRIRRVEWTADGRFLVVQRAQPESGATLEFFGADGRSARVVAGVSWAQALSPSGDLVAAGQEVKASQIYPVVILDTRKGKPVRRLAGAKGWPVMRFVDEDRLLVGTGWHHEPIRLWRVSDGKLLWEVKSVGAVKRIVYEPKAAAAVCHYLTGAEVLSIADGRALPPPAGRRPRPAWHHPTLIRGGRLALEPVNGSNIIALKETATARTLATFAAFADPDWIVFTPAGLWDGSANALKWVEFYRGAEPLSRRQIDALRRPAAIRDRLRAALR